MFLNHVFERIYFDKIPLVGVRYFIPSMTKEMKKSVEKFENWWAGLTYKQKMDMLAEQDNQLKMLKEFNIKENVRSEELEINDFIKLSDYLKERGI